MLDNYYLEGDAMSYQRVLRDGKPDWDLSVVAGQRGALLFALDSLQARPGREGLSIWPAAGGQLRFPLPAYAASRGKSSAWTQRQTAVEHTEKDDALEIGDHVSRVAIYVAATCAGERARIEARGKSLLAEEASLGFDPGETLPTLKS